MPRLPILVETEGIPSRVLGRVPAEQAPHVDRLLALVAEEYKDEHARSMRSPSRRKADRIVRLAQDDSLLGPVDLDYDFDIWHVGLNLKGPAGASVIQWLLGDWIAYGNQKFGERYARASKISGYDPQTLMNMVYVATRFPVSRRRENLSWSPHETLAALEPEDQDRWLDQAAEHRWSVSDLRTMLRVSRKAEQGEAEEGEEDETEAGQEWSQPVVKCPRCGEEISVD